LSGFGASGSARNCASAVACRAGTSIVCRWRQGSGGTARFLLFTAISTASVPFIALGLAVAVAGANMLLNKNAAN